MNKIPHFTRNKIKKQQQHLVRCLVITGIDRAKSKSDLLREYIANRCRWYQSRLISGGSYVIQRQGFRSERLKCVRTTPFQLKLAGCSRSTTEKRAMTYRVPARTQYCVPLCKPLKHFNIFNNFNKKILNILIILTLWRLAWRASMKAVWQWAGAAAASMSHGTWNMRR